MKKDVLRHKASETNELEMFSLTTYSNSFYLSRPRGNVRSTITGYYTSRQSLSTYLPFPLAVTGFKGIFLLFACDGLYPDANMKHSSPVYSYSAVSPRSLLVLSLTCPDQPHCATVTLGLVGWGQVHSVWMYAAPITCFTAILFKSHHTSFRTFPRRSTDTGLSLNSNQP